MPSRFPYEAIVDELRASILDGRLGPGERLESENQLAERYGTSRPTVRRATALLKAEGLLTTEQGRGVFVRARPQVRLLLSGENFGAIGAPGCPGSTRRWPSRGRLPSSDCWRSRPSPPRRTLPGAWESLTRRVWSCGGGCSS